MSAQTAQMKMLLYLDMCVCVCVYDVTAHIFPH